MSAYRSPDSPFEAERSPEESILLRAICGSPGDAIPPPPDSGGPLDWDLLRRLATHHGVFPLVYQKMKSPEGDRTPESAKSEFRRLYLKNAGRNLLLAQKLLELLNLFRDNGIEAIPFKGPVLAAWAYGSVSLRRFCDLDILVRPQDIGRTADLLSSRGFVPACRLSKLQQRVHRRFTCELGFVQPDENLHLDIHWRFAALYLAPGFAAIDPFARSRKIVFEGGEIATLPPDILLLFLCLHGTFHLWTSLSHVSDIARVVETGGVWDWDGLLKKGEETGLTRILLLGLALAQEFCGVKLPQAVCDRIGLDRRLERLRRHARRRLFSNRGDSPGFGELALFQMRAQDSWQGRLRYLLLRLFLPTVEDWKRLPLPDILFFLYFLFRPLRIAGHILFRRRSPDPDQWS
jgi:hypothetical protein